MKYMIRIVCCAMLVMSMQCARGMDAQSWAQDFLSRWDKAKGGRNNNINILASNLKLRIEEKPQSEASYKIYKELKDDYDELNKLLAEAEMEGDLFTPDKLNPYFNENVEGWISDATKALSSNISTGMGYIIDKLETKFPELEKRYEAEQKGGAAASPFEDYKKKITDWVVNGEPNYIDKNGKASVHQYFEAYKKFEEAKLQRFTLQQMEELKAIIRDSLNKVPNVQPIFTNIMEGLKPIEVPMRPSKKPASVEEQARTEIEKLLAKGRMSFVENGYSVAYNDFGAAVGLIRETYSNLPDSIKDDLKKIILKAINELPGDIGEIEDLKVWVQPSKPLTAKAQETLEDFWAELGVAEPQSPPRAPQAPTPPTMPRMPMPQQPMMPMPQPPQKPSMPPLFAPEHELRRAQPVVRQAPPPPPTFLSQPPVPPVMPRMSMLQQPIMPIMPKPVAPTPPMQQQRRRQVGPPPPPPTFMRPEGEMRQRAAIFEQAYTDIRSTLSSSSMNKDAKLQAIQKSIDDAQKNIDAANL